MPIQIVNAQGSAVDQLRSALEAVFSGDEVHVDSPSAGHFTLRVVSRQFDGLSRVQQQQLVYRAIGHLMAGSDAPVHAIDRMETRVPE